MQTGEDVILYVGTGFGDETPPREILRLRLSADGELSVAGDPIVTPNANPGWISRCEGILAVVGYETDPGMLQAFHVGPDGSFEPRGSPVSSVGRHPCYVALDITGRWCFAANYTEGSVCVCPVRIDGTLGAATDSKKHQGGELIDAALHDRQEGEG